ncbi:MAG: DUF4097 family beta strand repeat-containing protein [Methanocella sp.]
MIKGKKKVVVVATGAIAGLIILCTLGVFFLCIICMINSNPFPGSENDFPPPPTNNTTRYPFSADFFLRTHAPAENITLTGTFEDWSDTSYHNVKVMGGMGDIRAWSWGAISPNINYGGDSHDLSINWDTHYLSDDSWGGGVPGYDYMYLPFYASCDITLNNHIGSVIVKDLNGPSLHVTTNRGMLRIENCSFARIDCTATTRINGSFSSGKANFQSESGDITLSAREINGSITARSEKGNIILYVPAGSRFTLKASTGSGRVMCDFPLMRSVDQPNRIEGVTDQLSQPENTIGLRTERGNIRIIAY